jgi:hypothetical protein
VQQYLSAKSKQASDDLLELTNKNIDALKAKAEDIKSRLRAEIEDGSASKAKGRAKK